MAVPDNIIDCLDYDGDSPRSSPVPVGNDAAALATLNSFYIGVHLPSLFAFAVLCFFASVRECARISQLRKVRWNVCILVAF